MANIGQRIFILVLLGLFLISSFGLTIFVIWQNHQNSSSSSSSSSTPPSASASTSPTSSTKLEGTKLAGFTPTSSVSTLKITDLKVGSGPAAKSSDTVTVDYTGALAATGVIFQSTQDSGQPVSSPLSGFIKGWIEGIPGMKVGGERQLLIPASLAYGASSPPGSGIPANSPLVFNVTLDKIN